MTPTQSSSGAPETTDTEGRNRLASETSPYLLQHKNNPVHWWGWGPDAFAAARALDRPIFLSIGYSTCYWCHVMERESFENEAIAAIMNDNFICIKVDREERPDVDDIYMAAVQVSTGGGGWPMSVFLDPKTLKPFYGGTYFPVPTFPRLLESIAAAWREQRQPLLDQANRIAKAAAAELSTAPYPFVFWGLQPCDVLLRFVQLT